MLGAAALGTVFFARAPSKGLDAYLSGANLVILIAAIAFAATFLLVGLLPKRLQQVAPPIEDTDPATPG